MSEKPPSRKRRPSAASTRPACSATCPRRARRASAASAATARPPRSRSREAATKPKAEGGREAEAEAAAPRPAAAAATPHRPRPVRAGAPALAESTERARSEPRAARAGAAPPTGTELVTTAIQAAGELAQIGLTVGGQVAQARRRPAPEAVATRPRRPLLACRAPNRRGTQPRRTGDPLRTCSGRGGESAGLPAVALLSLREPVSSPRRHRRKHR